MPFTIGENVGPYRLIEQLGQGGMATIFKAYHPALDRYVAIKALHPALMQENNFLARFQREAQVVARLEHPNIVPVYDFAEHEGRPYLVMKYVEGETLKARLSRGPLAQNEIQRVIDSVGAALDYAHAKGVLHRDVKPSNVLLSQDGVIYLADFGLARMAQAGESTISSDVMLGTPQYISPEQAMGQRDLDSGTDIYSFGILLYELLVGRVPYMADTPYSVIHDHIYAPLPLPRTRKPEIPEAIERVLLKALAKDRADRYETVGELVLAWNEAHQTSDSDALGASAQVDAPVLSQPAAGMAAASAAGPPGKNAFADLPGLPQEALAAQAGSSEGLSIAPAVRPKKRVKWYYVLSSIILICLCLAVLAGTRNQQRAQRLTQTAPAGMLPGPGIVDSTSVEPLQTEAVAAELARIQEQVANDPENPRAHLELVLAYQELGMRVDAQQAWKQAAQLAADDSRFFSEAAADFEERQFWLLAIQAYSSLLRTSRGQVGPELFDRINKALYLAASDANLEAQAAPITSLAAVRNRLVNEEILRARFALYHADAQRAEDTVRNLREQNSSLPELNLLEAEVWWQDGKVKDARQRLELIRQDPEMPNWVREVADLILIKLNSG